MPVVLRIKGYRFYFFSNEGHEPMHIHVEKAESNCKVWLDPVISFEYAYGFSSKEQKEILEIVNKNFENIKKVWDEYFER